MADEPRPQPESKRIHWRNILIAALLMVATMPGRTQGLGLITEPLLRDLQLDRVTYANLNLWATLLGALICLPAGGLFDKLGLRWTSSAIVLLLSAVVWQMSGMAGGVVILFTWLLLTRALGQSALSVASISLAGKSSKGGEGMAMGVYATALSVLFAIAFVVVGKSIETNGWRTAWNQLALALAFGVVPLTILFLREPERVAKQTTEHLPGASLEAALRTRVFWVFAAATALFGLVSSGLGLFNEAVLAEAGFDAATYHSFLAATFIFGLLGQMLCGWLALRRPMPALMSVGMLLYAVGLLGLPLVHAQWQLWMLAAIMGAAGGFITVIFFAVWGQAFGRRHLGRIQGAAQMLSVFASALGPLLFAECHARAGSYAPLLYGLVPVVLITGFLAWRTKLPREARG
ncbi:MAG: transporter [Verrucomicrobiaceae bacterium]|nr:transporter [Verrucomicrobiaceae bacterium]